MHGLLASQYRVTILCYPLVCIHCGPVVDFFITKQTSLHPFDFVRNLFHLLVTNILGTNTVNVTDMLQTYCTRHADGTFCPLKILEESTGTLPVPLCTTGLPNACNTTCQESYCRLSSRLGCCGGTWFAPLSSFERFFNSCNVTLAREEQCAPASGAGVLYLSMLLVVAASLLSTIIV